MKTRKVLKREYLPSRLPFLSTAVWWLLLDRLGAPGWAWGASGVLLALFWGVVIFALWHTEEVTPDELLEK